MSLLHILSKIQEKCVAVHLVPHVSDASCVSHLLQVFHEIGAALEKGLETDIIHLDFAKEFDSVCHEKLLTKLIFLE